MEIEMTIAEAYREEAEGPFIYKGQPFTGDGYEFTEIVMLNSDTDYYALVSHHASGGKGSIGISGDRLISVR